MNAEQPNGNLEQPNGAIPALVFLSRISLIEYSPIIPTKVSYDIPIRIYHDIPTRRVNQINIVIDFGRDDWLQNPLDSYQ